MIPMIIVLTAKNEADVPELEKLLKQQSAESLKEPGCERFEVYHSTNDAKVFILCEHWADQPSIDAHRQANAYKTIYQPKVLPLVERVPHVSKLIVS
jgi:quinol monooxygenase YgiN